jgi:hypothetical protein
VSSLILAGPSHADITFTEGLDGTTPIIVVTNSSQNKLVIKFKDAKGSKADAETTKQAEISQALSIHLVCNCGEDPLKLDSALYNNMSNFDDSWYFTFTEGTRTFVDWWGSKPCVISREGLTWGPKGVVAIDMHKYIRNQIFKPCAKQFFGAMMDAYNPADLVIYDPELIGPVLLAFEAVFNSNVSKKEKLRALNNIIAQAQENRVLVCLSLKKNTYRKKVPGKASIEAHGVISQGTISTYYYSKYSMQRIKFPFDIGSKYKETSWEFDCDRWGETFRIVGGTRQSSAASFGASCSTELRMKNAGAQLGKVPTGVLAELYSDTALNNAFAELFPGTHYQSFSTYNAMNKKQKNATWSKFDADEIDLWCKMVDFIGFEFPVISHNSSDFRKFVDYMKTRDTDKDQRDFIQYSQAIEGIWRTALLAVASNIRRLDAVLNHINLGAQKITMDASPFVKLH